MVILGLTAEGYEIYIQQVCGYKIISFRSSSHYSGLNSLFYIPEDIYLTTFHSLEVFHHQVLLLSFLFQMQSALEDAPLHHLLKK